MGYLSLRLIRSYIRYGEIGDLADKLGVHRNTLSRKLNGNQSFMLEEVNAIAQALGVGVEKFLTEERESEG